MNHEELFARYWSLKLNRDSSWKGWALGTLFDLMDAHQLKAMPIPDEVLFEVTRISQDDMARGWTIGYYNYNGRVRTSVVKGQQNRSFE